MLAIYETLPRNDDGQVIWMQALADKLIAPKPGIADDAKDEEPTDMDVELVPKGQPEFKVVFSHKVHTSWLGCPACHTALFEMEKGKTVITMDKINAGDIVRSVSRQGGRTRADGLPRMPQGDGQMKITRAVLAAVALLAFARWRRQGATISATSNSSVRARGGMEIPPAVFPHALHRIAYKCGACHDDLFPMKAGSTKVTMEAIQDGKSCGTCHNGMLAFESSFATCPRCHRE